MTLSITFAGPVPPITGGIASHAACTIKAMREAGATVRTLSWASQYPRLLYKGSGVDPASAPFDGASFDLRWWNPASWLRAGRIASAGDLLVVPWVTPVHALPQWVMHASANVPLSLLVHNALPHERMPFDTQLARLVMRRAAQIVVHTEFLAEQIADLAPGVPVSVVPHPPQLPVTVTPMPDAPPLRLLCFGFVRDYKGFDIAVAALRRLHDRGIDARLTIAGEVWGDAAPWYQHARELGITLIPRYLTDAEVVDLVASHHLLVAPYRSATQSGPVSLAFGSGRPVVATSVGGLQEAVTDGVNGRLVPPGDVAALSDAIEEVSKDLEGYARGAGATHLTWSHVADALLAPVLR